MRRKAVCRAFYESDIETFDECPQNEVLRRQMTVDAGKCLSWLINFIFEGDFLPKASVIKSVDVVLRAQGRRLVTTVNRCGQVTGLYRISLPHERTFPSVGHIAQSGSDGRRQWRRHRA
jgi:hypothetical protein